jgi:O-methyltransferase
MSDPFPLNQRFVDAINERMAEQVAGLGDDPASRMIATLIREERAWVDVPRLQHLHQLAESYQGQPGAFVECGVARGACLVMMAAGAGDRTVWGFDSFEGLPEQTDADRGDGAAWVGWVCSGESGEAAVVETFGLVGVPMANVRLVKGWFSDTVPATAAEVGPIAVLRVDADWYEGTRYVLAELHDQVQSGGTVLVDDYGSFAGCRQAVVEFMAAHPELELQVGDTGEAYWRKP